jgi:Uma2 family endonuclease
MIAQPQLSPPCTPADYLEFEVNADIRHEYINGEIVPMTGGTPNHNQILLNLAGALNFALETTTLSSVCG